MALGFEYSSIHSKQHRSTATFSSPPSGACRAHHFKYVYCNFCHHQINSEIFIFQQIFSFFLIEYSSIIENFYLIFLIYLGNFVLD